VYIPAVEFDGAKPTLESYFAITNVFWKRPKNWSDIVDAVRWAANEEFPITVEGPDFLVANCTLQRQAHRMLLHLVNYRATTGPIRSDVRVRVVLPDNKKVRTATLYVPDSTDARSLTLNSDGSGVAFSMPEIAVYALISVQW
jgi:hypothetical protein